MLICIIGRNLSSGILVDVTVLKSALLSNNSQATVDVIDIANDTQNDKQYDISFILEHITPDILKIDAKYTIFIPNVEVLVEWDLNSINKVDCIMCKTHASYNWFNTRTKLIKVCYTGFTSPTRDSDEQLQRSSDLWAHFGGTSYLKGTVPLLMYWVKNNGFLDQNSNLKLLVTFSRDANNPDYDGIMKFWNGLKTTASVLNGVKVEKYLNIYRVDHLDHDHYSYFLNTVSVFIQPSVNEGFGHTINEKRQLNALCITTDAPPMNELITHDELLIPSVHSVPITSINKYKYASKTGIRGYCIDHDGFVKVVKGILKMSSVREKELIRITNANFKSDREDFTKRFINLVYGTRQNTEYAYVTLLFGGDRYLPGILALAYSIKKYKNKNDIVCMVTPDVPRDACDKISKLGVIVYPCDYLRFTTKKLKSIKQNERYSKWQDVSFTKWQCLGLTQYKKVLFLDADMIAKTLTDDVFDIPTPAGLFKNPWLSKNNYYDKYNKVIPTNEIKSALNDVNRFVPSATCILLSPNATHLSKYKKMVASMQPFGLKSLSMMDEESIAYFVSVFDGGPKRPWNKLGVEYAYMWKYGGKIPSNVKFLDFLGDKKPWEMDRGEYPDLEEWYKIWDELQLQ